MPINALPSGGLCAILLLLSTTLLACTTTTTRTVVHERASVNRLVLAQPESSPLMGWLSQEGHSVVGKVGFTRECLLRTTRTLEKTKVSETKMSEGAAAAYIATGAALAAVGTALMAASQSKSDTVSCGEGRAGDTCNSPQSAFMYGGAGFLLGGVVFGAAGGIGLVVEPTRETKSLHPESVVADSAAAPCGTAESLGGIRIALQLPNGSRWTGPVEANGAARIDVSPDVSFPDAEVVVFVDEVPEALSAVVSRGVEVATVSLSRTVRTGPR
jgi:hypothetical protein